MFIRATVCNHELEGWEFYHDWSGHHLNPEFLTRLGLNTISNYSAVVTALAKLVSLPWTRRMLSFFMSNLTTQFKTQTKAAAGAHVMLLGALVQFQDGSNCACCSLGVNGKLLMTATTISPFKWLQILMMLSISILPNQVYFLVYLLSCKRSWWSATALCYFLTLSV